MPKAFPQASQPVYLLGAAAFEASFAKSRLADALYQTAVAEDFYGGDELQLAACTFAHLLEQAEQVVRAYPEYGPGLPRLRRACVAAEAAGYTHLNFR